MSAILSDDEDVLAGLEKGERTVVVNPRELALQAIEDGRIREFETESGLKVPAQPAIDEDMDPDDVAAEQERARLEAVADGKAANIGATRADADADQLQRQVQDAAPTVIDNFDNVLVKRKVNGVEEMVPLADVMRTHQKTAAADQRLEEATRLLREAEARSRFAHAPEPGPQGFRRGEVVVFRGRTDREVEYVKRIIGLPGDRVRMLGGVLHLNGVPVARERIGAEADGRTRYREWIEPRRGHDILEMTDSGHYDNTAEFLVPDGHLFLLGDNRDNSLDSRAGVGFGYVPFADVTARARFILWGPDRARIGTRLD